MNYKKSLRRQSIGSRFRIGIPNGVVGGEIENMTLFHREDYKRRAITFSRGMTILLLLAISTTVLLIVPKSLLISYRNYETFNAPFNDGYGNIANLQNANELLSQRLDESPDETAINNKSIMREENVDTVTVDATVKKRKPLGFDDWPMSKIDEIRQNRAMEAIQPESTSSLEDIDCPQCSSFLAGAVLHKRFLLLGHALQFAGGEIWLRDLGEMLENSGATVRFLFLKELEKSNMKLLDSHIESGLSYIFWDRDEHDIAFEDFDFVIANTAAVETWHHFFETASNYKSKAEIESLYSKTIFCVHEYNVTQYTNAFLKSLLPKVPKLIFDSDAGKNEWLKDMPELADRSVTLYPGITKHKMLNLLDIADDKEAQQTKLKIPTIHPEDTVILQASSVCKHKGIEDLIGAFNSTFAIIPNNVIQKRAWFLVIVGENCGVDYTDRIEEVNNLLATKEVRSRILLRPATPDIASYYKAADIFVLNSECENFGMVFVEAMLAGKPTIGRDCGGAREIIEDGKTGILLPNKEPNQVELSRAFVEMTTGPNWRIKLNEMGVYGRTRATREFSYVKMAREFSNIIAAQRYFSASDPLWTCSSQEEKGNTLVTTRSHSEEMSPVVPALPGIKSYDIGCANVGTNLYVYGGYQDLNHVTKKMQYYDIQANVWVSAPSLPPRAAESHSASTQDDRYLYSLSGQLGAQCSPPVKHSFMYDTVEQQWYEIPELPVARYGGCAGILNGRLHFVGGFDDDRRTPMPDHYSMLVNELHSWISNPSSEKPVWRKEPEIPNSTGHVLCKVLTTQEGPKLFFFGGEVNDYYPRDAKNGDHTCVPGLEFNRPFVFSFDGASWKRGPDMPYPLSHAEGSRTVSSSSDGLFIFGGSGKHEQELMPDVPVLTDGILWFSADTQDFKRVGTIYPLGTGRKGTCGIGHIDTSKGGKDRGQVTMFVVGGQGSQSTSLPWAGPINKYAMLCKGNFTGELKNSMTK
jgi:glycosyltransferase involved in cell wall biosynthesis